MRTAFPIILKVTALTMILFICFALAGRVLGQQGSSQTPEGAETAAMALLAMSFISTSVLTYIILRSSWAGWRLVATVFFVFYGVVTFMSQIESAVFITHLPSGMLPRLFLMGALTAAPFSMLAVLILGRRKADIVSSALNTRLVMPTSEWVWKLTVIAVAYLILYFTFGYFVAWRDPLVREYYGGIDEGSLFTHMLTVVRSMPWLIPFQVLRAMFWVVLALPVVRMMKGQWQETSLAIALLFGVLMTAPLLLPNPYMPEAVRMTHLLETGSSNFLFGLLVGWLLAQRHGIAKMPIAV